jgi:ABC-type uncharacterized transport system auxiliary subunit
MPKTVLTNGWINRQDHLPKNLQIKIFEHINYQDMKNQFFYLFISLVIFSGCIGSKPQAPSFYLLEYPADRTMSFGETDNPLPVIVEAEDVNISPAFASYDIVLRANSHEIRYFDMHRWATRPVQSMTSFLLTFFERNNVFENAGPRFWKVPPHYKLKTTIFQMEIFEEDKKFYARLHLELQLKKIDTEQVVLTHVADNRQALEERDLNLFADAISNMFFDELQAFSLKTLSSLPNE